MHYPLGPQAATGLALAAGVVVCAWPHLWLLLLPALLPVIGLAPWTGWITFEELDILVLVVAAGGYARMAWANAGGAQRQHRRSLSVLVWLMLGLFALSTATAMFRGFADAGGFVFGWFQGYHEPMNSVRLAKSFFEALLLFPLWQGLYKQNPERSQNLLSQGLMLGLVFAALTTVWERTAFTGLLNFSSDYRTTAMFWEMHVGGAALDGFLALTVPFALRELVVARTPARWGLAAGAMALAAYACLTTFSRGVYLAIPVGALVFMGLHIKQQKQRPTAPIAGAATAANGPNRAAMTTGLTLATALILITGFGAGATWMFPSSGYRGLVALLTTSALALVLAQVLRGFKFNQWLLGWVLGVMFSLVAMAIAWLTPKGAYVAWGLAVVLAAGMLALLRRGAQAHPVSGPLALAGFLTAVAGTALVAERWGEAAGLAHAAPALLGLLAVAVVAGVWRRPLWPESLRWQTTTVCAMAMVGAVIGIFGGGSYMGERFSTGGQDLGGRTTHWALGRSMLTTPADWWLGKGLGRFPASYFLTGKPQEHPGDYRLKQEGAGEAANTYLTLTGGLIPNGSWGELFRVTQRVAEPGKPVFVTAQVRAVKDVTLHFEVCEKHLLYNQRCMYKASQVKGMQGVWQPLRVDLAGDNVMRGDWYAPHLIAFSVAIGSYGGTVDLDNLALTGAGGRSLLTNGEFSGGMAHWFFSSDKYHLPWHIKSVFMNVLFDQGMVGAALLALLMAGALWRSTLGAAHSHPLAPALAASLVGFAVVGLFDSLLDVPRLAWLFYLLLMVALTLRGQARAPQPARVARAAAGLGLLVVAGGIGFQPSDALAAQAEPVQQMIRVGPSRDIKTIAEAAYRARAGAIIEVDSGEYMADVAVWTQDRITVRAVGGRVKLVAAGAAAESKAIWVVRAGQMWVDGFDFTGARVPDRNGAGIRFERGFLQVRNCTFTDNENGILTRDQFDAVLEIENSEFGHNGHGDGQSHNLYVGAIGRLAVRGSYFHHAKVGHLLKSRAAVNEIFYNRLTDGNGGRASYELEFPSGGLAYVVGNIIQQGAQTENPHLVSYGAEGYKWAKNEFYLVNNTLIDNRPQGGIFLRVRPGIEAVKAVNNLLVGPGNLASAGPGDYRNNFNVSLDEFAQAAGEDYRLKRGSGVARKAIDPGSANGVNLRPAAEYVHRASTQALAGALHNPGALQSMPPNAAP